MLVTAAELIQFVSLPKNTLMKQQMNLKSGLPVKPPPPHPRKPRVDSSRSGFGIDEKMEILI